MAHTRFLDSLVRLSRLSRTSDIHAELFSRRRFLQRALVGAATLALPPRLRAQNSKSPKIAIIGAGMAGLNCALTLADKGIRADVYEASQRMGGRVFSNNRGYWAGGQVTEWCAELIDTNHATMHQLAARFGLTLDNLLAAEPPGATETFYFNNRHWPRADVVKEFQPVLAAVRKDAAAAGDATTWNSSTPAGRALDNMSVRAWIESRVPGGLASMIGALLDVAFTIEYGADTADQSALNIIGTLSGSDEKFEIFGASDERFHLLGGNQQLPEAIAAHLQKAGAPIHTGMSLTDLRERPDGRYHLTFGPKEVVTDIVVLTLPFPVLRTLDLTRAGFAPRKIQAIQTLGGGKNAKLQLQFTDRLWNKPGPWGISSGSTFSDRAYQNTWEPTRAQPGPCGILNDYLGAAAVDRLHTIAPFSQTPNPSATQDADAFLASIKPVFPGLPPLWNRKATLSIPHLSPLFKCAYSYWKVGQCQTIAGYERIRQKNILFAGEHTSTDFQGFMEGAAQEGRRAAEEILRHLALKMNSRAEIPSE